MLYCLFAFIMISNISWLGGNFILNIVKLNLKPFERIFYSFLIGIFIPVIIYSIIISNFQTINILFILPCISLLFLYRKKNQIDLSSLLKRYKLSFKSDIFKLNILAVSVGMFALLLNWINFRFGISADTFMYASIIKNLNNGFENGLIEYQNLGLSAKAVPYHYFELWITGAIKVIFHSTSISIIFQNITFPILLLTLSLGILAIINQFKEIRNHYIFFVFLLLFVSPFIVDQTAGFMNYLFNNSSPIFEIPGLLNFSNPVCYFGIKNIPIYIVFMLFCLLVVRGKFNLAYITISTLYLINIAFVPTLFPAITLYFIYKILKKENDTNYLKIWSFHFILLISIGLFYFVFDKVPKANYSISTIEILHYDSNLSWKGILLNSALRIFMGFGFILVSYLPYIFIAYKMKIESKPIRDIIVLTIFMLSISLFSRTLLSGVDSIQFVTYMFPVVNGLIIIMLVIGIVKENKIFNPVFIITCSAILVNVFITIYLSNNLNKTGFTFIEKVQNSKFETAVINELKQTTNAENQMIGFVLEDSFLNKSPGITWKYFLPGKFLFVNDFHFVISLNYPNFKTSFSDLYTKPTGFNHQRLFFPVSGSKEEFQNHLPSFVREKKCKFIIARKNVLIPTSIEKLYNRKIVGIEEVFYISDSIK
jgi:hypothetical protein